ncbi:hypothetical protein [Microbacterium hydrocarbonoxydans]|uniref:hypothetical protein n=1 Tax=Microbacterium hydrocarbonoxydans TaxID=273678 RepID=UPI00203BEBEB|nr:hypothetical protein [Microbacterium hydrocarbonoxydans]MCM3778978.1 hypothetical protein [Microbacterium hydrocarbonoxydans]
MSTDIPTPRSASASLAGIASKRRDDPAAVASARAQLAAANIQAAIQKNLADAPPLTADQTERLTALLRGGAR